MSVYRYELVSGARIRIASQVDKLLQTSLHDSTSGLWLNLLSGSSRELNHQPKVVVDLVHGVENAEDDLHDTSLLVNPVVQLQPGQLFLSYVLGLVEIDVEAAVGVGGKSTIVLTYNGGVETLELSASFD